jgi:hypothetical protein
VKALRLLAERHGTRLDLVVWIDPERGTGGVAWPDLAWSAGDLTPRREGLAFWCESRGLTGPDAATVADLVPLGWWALAGDGEALDELRRADGVRSVTLGERAP